jgi:tRNA threonylcarbamoyladenosine biosynthesis protein TsaB
LKLLAFDTSTETMSIAVGRDAQLWEHRAAGGAKASATLIPAILDLLGQAGLRLAELDAIVFGRGPGSFTGVRTACSVAQGLAFGAGRPVLPVDTLMAVAEDARRQAGATKVVAVLDARMDEVYWAAYEWDASGWHRRGEFGLGKAESVGVPDGWTLAGNAFEAYPNRFAPAPTVSALPTGAALLAVAPALLARGLGVGADHALPLYIRDKVAQTTDERAAARAAALPPA